ncbi:MAG TPA: hypothetical protein VIF62_04095 [Labilithrix sp.]|jgi:hypothetical protein
MAISRARRLAASAALFGASGGLGWVALRDRFWGLNPLLVIVTLSVALAGIAIARKSVLAQIGARAVAWSVALPMAVIATLELATRSSPDRLVWFLAATTGSALLLGRPMLHSDEAKRDFAPVRYRRTFLAGATASATTALFAGAASLDLANAHQWGAAFGIGALATSLVASAFGTLRMRGWGILLGATTSAISFLMALLVHDAASIPLALAAIPGALLALPIAASRLGKPTEARMRVEAAAPPRIRVAPEVAEEDDVPACVEPARARAEVG